MNLRIVVVGSSEHELELIRGALAAAHWTVELVLVQTVTDLDAVLAAGDVNLVLTNHSPVLDAADVVHAIGNTGRDVPCIVVASSIDEDATAAVSRAGVADVIVLPRLARLVPAISRELRDVDDRFRRRVAEDELAAAHQRILFALETAGVGIWDLDQQSRRTSWSEVSSRLHGIPADAFRGTFEHFVEAVHPFDRGRVQAQIEDAFRPDADLRLEYRTAAQNGAVRWITCIGRTFGGDVASMRAVGVCIDSTTEKRVEEEVRHAQKMESIGNLASGVAHDFNNVLSIVTGYCDLLTERLSGEPEGLREVGEIRSAASRAALLTREMLAFSRRQILSPRTVQLNDLIRNVHSGLAPAFPDHIRTDLQLADDLVPVHVDPGQMEQVLLNLAINSRDAMPGGGVLTIETSNVELDAGATMLHPELPRGRYVSWSVSDNGVGMTPEIRQHAFEPFFTTKEKGRGTGLGLATAHGIVRQSGGHIWVYSEPGFGTTVKIFLPAAPNPESTVAVAQSRGLTSASLRGDETILLVEDDEHLRKLNERLLRRFGYSVLAARDAVSARVVASGHDGPIHLALVDVVMPGESGRSVGDWLRDRRPDTIVLYMSGYTNSAIVHDGVLEPGTAFLQKPFDSAQLATRIRELLDGAERSPAIADPQS